MDGQWTTRHRRGMVLFGSGVGVLVENLANGLWMQIEDTPWYLVDQANDLCEVVAERDAEYSCRVNGG